MRLLRIGVSVIALTALAAIQAGAAPKTMMMKAPSGPPVTVGVILSMTGPYAPLGEPERNAINLAEKDINAHGGVHGRPIKFDIVDDEGKADTAQQLATQMVGRKVAMIIGASLTPTSRVIARVANDAKIAHIFMTPTQDIWNTKNGVLKYTFEVTPRNEIEAEKLAGFIKNRLGKKRIAVLHDDQQYGTVGGGIFSAEAKRQGLEIVADDQYAPTATDVTAQLGKVRAANADTIVIWTASPAAALIVRQARQLGLHTDIVGSTGIVSGNFLRVAKSDGFGVYADQDIDLTYPGREQKAFITAYRGAYNIEPVNFASFAWDAAHIAAMALSGTKIGDGDALAHWLATMKPYRGTTGEFRFTESDHNGLSASDIRIVRDNPKAGTDGEWRTLPASQQ